MDSIRSKLAEFKQLKHFYHWDEAPELAEELAVLLDRIGHEVTDPVEGLGLLSEVFGLDEILFQHCDDSSGTVGEVFLAQATELFARYARRCQDKQRVRTTVLKLCLPSGYGIRDGLISSASDYLATEDLRALADSLWQAAQPTTDEGDMRSLMPYIVDLARQLLDAELMERAYRAVWGKLGTAARIDLATVNLRCERPAEALAWLEESTEQGFMDDERDALLLEIHRKLGQQAELEATAWRIFRRCRSLETLGTLLEAVGTDHKQELIEAEVAILHESADFDPVDAAFLLKLDLAEDAQHYLLARLQRVDGNNYTALLPLAEMFTSAKHPLAASSVYRSLISAILSRAQSKYYYHAVRYLRELEKLEPTVEVWSPLSPHDDYMAGLRQTHGRKYAFWRQVE